jgi:hypothetical protein
LEAHGLAYSTARSRERIAEDCTREFASEYHSITDLQFDLGHIKERTKEYAPESPKTDDWKAGWEQPPATAPSTASPSSPKPTTAAKTVTSPPSKPPKATGKSPSSKATAPPPSPKPTAATGKVPSPPAPENPNDTIAVAVEFAGEDQQTAWLNALDRAINDATLTVEFSFSRKQLRRIVEIVEDDLESYQPATLDGR